MIDKLKRLVAVLDLPAGVIMGVWSLSMVGMSWHAVLKRVEIPTTVITLYGMGLGAFAIHRTAKVLTEKEQPQ